MPIYFLRHGESEANVQGLFAGQKNDSPLTSLGIKQAQDAAVELQSVNIDIIISSSLSRARQTAMLVAEKLGYSKERIIYDQRIIEYDMGALTSTPIRKVSSRELVSSNGAENPSDFRNRVLLFLRDYKNNKETILVVSHAGVGRIIEAARQNISPEDFYDIDGYPNAQPIKLDLDWLK